MRCDNELERFWITQEELYVISRALIEFSQEIHWLLDIAKNEDVFKKEFETKFTFSLSELDYIVSEVWELESNVRGLNILEIFILLLNRTPKKATIIYTALDECSKNYEDYEISIRAGISKKDLDAVLKEFKEEVIDKMEIGSMDPTAQAD